MQNKEGDNGDRDWSDTAINQGTASVTGHHQKLRKGRVHSSLELSEEEHDLGWEEEEQPSSVQTRNGPE